MDVLRAADETYGGHPVSSTVHHGFRRGDYARVVGEPKVVVRAEIQHLLAGANFDFRLLLGCDEPLLLVEPGLSNRV